MNIPVEILGIILAQAKHHKTTPEAQLERFLLAGLSAERKRILTERIAIPTSREKVIIVDPCSEEYLRRMCGDHWEICWWASTCSIFGGGSPPPPNVPG